MELPDARSNKKMYPRRAMESCSASFPLSAPNTIQFLVRKTDERNFNAARKNDAPCNVSVYVCLYASNEAAPNAKLCSQVQEDGRLKGKSGRGFGSRSGFNIICAIA